MSLLARKDRYIADFVLLRYVIIIAASYMIVSQRGFSQVGPAAAMLIVGAFASNLILGRFASGRFSLWQIAGVIVILDTLWISAAMVVVGNVSKEFFFLYFFVLFFAALADNLVFMLVGVLAASGAYLWVISHITPGSVWRQDHMVQISLLFSAALFYGVLVDRARQQRRHVETIEASDLARTELLATLAHDIGGPANVITLGVQALRDTFDDDTASEMRSLCAAVERNSRYLAQLVQHFIEYSRLRSGSYRMQPNEFSVNAVIEQVVAQHAIDAHAREVSLKLALQPTPRVVLDEVALVRVLNNLIDCVLRGSSPASEVVVHTAQENGGVRIAIGGCGLNLSAEQLDRIGQSFADTSAIHAGTGLALFIARSLVQAQGGSLTAVSQPAGAMQFVVHLPLAVPSVVEDDPTPSPA